MFSAVFLICSIYYNKPVKLPRTLVHYGKDCTWVWSRVLISHSAVPRTILASRPHPRTIFSVMHSRCNLTRTYTIQYNRYAISIKYYTIQYNRYAISIKYYTIQYNRYAISIKYYTIQYNRYAISMHVKTLRMR